MNRVTILVIRDSTISFKGISRADFHVPKSTELQRQQFMKIKLATTLSLLLVTIVLIPTLAMGVQRSANQGDDDDEVVAAASVPRVSVLTPSSGLSVFQGAVVGLTAQASRALIDPASSILSVEYLINGVSVGSSSTEPYSVNWTPTLLGVASIQARVTDSKGRVARSSPVQVTVAIPPLSVGISSPANGERRDPNSNIQITTNVSSGGGTISKVEFFNGALKLGEDVSSPYTYDWNAVPKGNYTLTARVTDSFGNTATSSAVSVIVSQAPVVTLDMLPIQPIRPVPSTVALSATASDPDGTISKVEFHATIMIAGSPVTTKVCEQLAPPTSGSYACNWNATSAGVFDVFARAHDDQGATTDSAPISIGFGLPPTVTLILPGDTIRAPGSTLAVSATASDPDGSVVSVAYLVNDAFVATVPGPNFSYLLNVPTTPGIYSIKARATDNAGLTTTSAPSQFTVAVPTVMLTSPVSGTIRAVPASIGLSATASSQGATITQVQYFDGAGNSLGVGSGLGFNATWAGGAPGAYQVFARATDSRGAVSDSALANVTITATNQPPIVSLASPTAGQSFVNTVPLSVTASDSDGSVVQVRYFNAATSALIAEGNAGTSGFPATWSNAPAGTQQVYAIATDNSGATTQSPTTNFTVVQQAAPFTATLTVTGQPFVGVGNGAFVVRTSGNTASISQVQIYKAGQGSPYASAVPTGGQYSANFSNLPEGGHEFRAVVTDATSRVVESNTLYVHVGPATEPPPVDCCQGEQTGVLPGAMQGGGGASESGAATFTVPIAVPPGTAGLAPSLALSYSSQGGNGLLGMGWNLSGLSGISRCPKTVHHDGVKSRITYTNEDQFCLDGQRLILINGSHGGHGSEYRTERESYTRIVSYTSGTVSGPAYFKAWTKDGRVMTFGDVANSFGNADSAHKVVVGGVSVVKAWGLNRLEDRSGNYVDYRYAIIDGAMGPWEIAYTGNSVTGAAPAYLVRVRYEYRPASDTAKFYDSEGNLTLQQFRIRSIQTSLSSNPDANGIKRYQISYGTSGKTSRSLITQIQECSGEGGADGSCVDAVSKLGPTQFSWQETPAATLSGFGLTAFSINLPRDGITQAADLNGDGLSDYINYGFQPGNASTKHNWTVCLSQPAATPSCSTWTTFPDNFGAGNNRTLFGDFNGDGKVDLLVYHENSQPSQWKRCLSTGTSFDCAFVSMAAPFFENQLTGDFNGDGRTDVAIYRTNDTWQICLSTPEGFDCAVTTSGPAQGQTGGVASTIVGDFNGDGRADLAGFIGTPTNNSPGLWQICLSRFGETPVFTCKPVASATGRPVKDTHVSDFNGDGMADLVSYDTGLAKWHVCLSTGRGTFDCSYWDGHDGDVGNNILGDFNGDGRTDIARHGASGWRVCLSTGASFACENWAGPGRPDLNDGSAVDNTLLGDFNGDGKTDITVYKEGNLFHVGLSQGAVPDLLSTSTDALGVQHQFTYKTLTDPSVYDKGGDGIYPEIAIQSPMTVVSDFRKSDGLGGFYLTQYTYRGLRADTAGGGMSGFTRRAVWDPQAKTCVETETLQKTVSFNPWLDRRSGLVSRSSKYYNGALAVGACSSGLLVNRVDNVWEARQPNSGLKLFEHFLTASTEQSWEMNGTAMPRSYTSTPLSGIDSFGNAGSVVVTIGDSPNQYVKSTTSTFFNDAANWLVGKLASSTVVSSLPSTLPFATVNPSNTTKKAVFRYDTLGRLASETVEPDTDNSPECNAQPDSGCLKTSYGYDSYGNRTSATQYGYRVDRTSIVRYCSAATVSSGSSCTIDGRFPTYTANALQHSEFRVFDPRFGSVTQVTDPNGLVTTMSIDRFGRKYCEQRPDQSRSGTTWYAGGQAGGWYVVSKDSSGAEAESHLDQLGRERLARARAFNGQFAETRSYFDAKGRKNRVDKPFGNATGYITFTYDDFNRPLKEYGPGLTEGAAGNYQTEYAYNGLTTTITQKGAQSGDQITVKTLNPRGELIEVVDAMGNALKMQYDALGNLERKSSTTSAEGGTVTDTLMFYNSRGFKRQMWDPDHGSWAYSYTALGELSTQTDGNGAITLFEYDALGRLRFREDGSSTRQTRWFYDVVGVFTPCGVTTTRGRLCQVQGYQANTVYSYDSLTRPVKHAQDTYGSTAPFTGLNRVFESYTSYDSLSRVRSIVYPVTGLTVVNHYNAYGYLERIEEPATGRIHWQAQSRALDGQITGYSVGGIGTTRGYDALGRPDTSVTATYQNANYDFDAVGNLTARSDTARGFSETSTYDKLNRLKTATNNGGVQAMGYNGLGSILSKSDIGGYAYHTNRNRVQTAAGNIYFYDDNGSVTQIQNGAGNTDITYTWFGMPSRIARGTNELNYAYDGNKTRVIEARSNGNYSIYMLGGTKPFFEEDGSATQRRYKHYINTPEGALSLVVITDPLEGAATRSDKTFIVDHLGSTTAIVDEQGVQYLGYNAWGQRRNQDGQALPPGFVAKDDRGFTGHEMLDEFGFVHMNGRIYDPVIGRFLMADPIIQTPTNLQNYNRYSYVLNNPLSYTDPTGYSQWTKWRKPIFSIAVSWFIGYGDWSWLGGTSSGLFSSGVANAAAAGFASGGIMGGNLQSAMQGAFSGALLSGTLSFFGLPHNGAEFLSKTHLAKIAVHAAVGCITSHAGGGSCESGAAAGGFAELSGPMISSLEHSAAQFAATALLGGIGSKLAGGDFESGAFTAAFAYLFNSAADLRKKYSYGGGGHHTVPAESLDGLNVSMEMGKEFGRIKIRQVDDHVYDHDHRRYNTAVKEELSSWAKQNSVDLSKGTAADAKRFAAFVVNSERPEIKNYLGRVISSGIKAGMAPYSKLHRNSLVSASARGTAETILGIAAGSWFAERMVRDEVRGCLSGQSKGGGC